MKNIISKILIANRDVYESKELHFYNNLSTTLSYGDSEDGLKMFKAIIATMAFTKFDDTAISAMTCYQSGDSLIKRFADILGAREKLANKIILISTSKKSPLTIDNIKAIATAANMTYVGCTSKITNEDIDAAVKKNEDKAALIRVCKNILYAPDTETILFIIGGQIIGNATEEKHFKFLINRYPRFKAIIDDEALAVKILTGGFLNESLNEAIAAEEAVISEKLISFTKKRTIPMLEAKVNNARKSVEEARARYENAYNELIRAGEELVMIGDLNKLVAEKVERFFQYVNRLKSMGIVSHIRTEGTPSADTYKIAIMFKPLPIRYVDTAALKKCYENILTNISDTAARAKRKKHIENIIKGEEFLIATPATVILTFNSTINHVFSSPASGDAEFENPHFRYSERRGCLGTFATSITEAATEKDYMKYLGLLVQYVQTITPNDGAGNAGIQRLPICDAEGNIVLTETNEEPAEKIYKDEYFERRREV